MDYYSAIEKNETMAFAATCMDLEIITLSEVRQRRISYDFTYMWNLKNDTNELTYNTETRLEDFKNKLMVTKRESGGGGAII